MILLLSRLEKKSKRWTSKQANKQANKQMATLSLRHEIGVGKSLRAVGEEQHVCKGAQVWGDGDTPGSGC